MKLKLFFAAFAAVALMASCAERDDVKKIDENVLKTKTVATFTLNLSNPETKAFANFNPDPKDVAARERSIDGTDVRLVIIDQTASVVEINEMFGTAGVATTYTKTVQITAGPKRIYVIANAGPITNTQMNACAVGSSASAFEALYYDNSTPQFPWTLKSGTRSFDMTKLYAFAGTTAGLPASNSDMYTYEMQAGISATTSSSNPGGLSQVVSGYNITQTNNNFNIDLTYMVAKARLGYASTATSHVELGVTIANISNINYSVQNLARYTKYIQHVAGNLPQSWYYGKTFTTPYATALTTTYTTNDYLYHFDSGLNANLPAAAVTGTYPSYTFPTPAAPNTSYYVYVPENNNNTGLTWGQASLYAINTHYKPVKIVTAVGFEPSATPKLLLTQTASYPSPSIGYVYLRQDITGSNGVIEKGTCFETVALMQQAAWLTTYADNITGGGWDPAYLTAPTQSAQILALTGTCPPSAVPAQLPESPTPVYGYYVFSVPNAGDCTGGNWYRVAIGDPANTNAYYKYGVFRGKAYSGVLTGFSGPGVPYEWMLHSDPDSPVDATTNVTVTVTINDWTPVVQIIPVLP